MKTLAVLAVITVTGSVRANTQECHKTLYQYHAAYSSYCLPRQNHLFTGSNEHHDGFQSQIRCWFNDYYYYSRHVSGITLLAIGCRNTVSAARRQQQQVVCRAAEEDVLLRSLSDMGEVAVLVVQGTKLVQEAMTRHQTAPTATAALGRTLLGAALLGAYRKEDENIQIQFKGDGPLCGILAVADTKGQVKGKVGNPDADPPLRPDGKLAVGAAVGAGQLCVTRTHPGQPRPYTGIVSITSGEIAEDLANYLAESEQTNSALALGVCIDRTLHVKSAGGYLVQVLPFCSDETLDQLEKNLTGMPSMTQLLNAGLTPQQITDRILEGLGSSLSGESITPTYGPCEADALKERMMRAVASLGATEVRSIMEEQGKIEVTCELCNEQFQFSEADVMQYV